MTLPFSKETAQTAIKKAWKELKENSNKHLYDISFNQCHCNVTLDRIKNCEKVIYASILNPITSTKTINKILTKTNGKGIFWKFENKLLLERHHTFNNHFTIILCILNNPNKIKITINHNEKLSKNAQKRFFF